MADTSLDIADGDASPSEDNRAELLISSGGVGEKLDTNPKTLLVSCRETLGGSRAGKSGASTEGSKP